MSFESESPDNEEEEVNYVINSLALKNTLVGDGAPPETVTFGKDAEVDIDTFNGVRRLTIEFNGHLEETDYQEPRIAIGAFFIDVQPLVKTPIYRKSSVARQFKPATKPARAAAADAVDPLDDDDEN